MKQRLVHYIDTIFGADLRSLALFRVVLALVIIGDLIVRSGDLVAHYTDVGVLPRDYFFQHTSWYNDISLHLITGSAAGETILFGIAGFFALLLLVGYRTQIVTAVSWILLVSLQVRNPFVLNSGDLLFSLLLLWSIFLPLGARYSFDSALNTKSSHMPTRIVSLATAAMLLQLVSLYWFSVLLKSGPEWRSDGTAVYYALNLSRLVTPIGNFFLPFSSLLTILTWAVLLFEIIGPALLFIPSGPVRFTAVILFLMLHLGFGTFLTVGIFPWVAGLLFMVYFLPTWFWERISKLCAVPMEHRVQLYYDVSCGFCERSVRLLQTFLFLPAEVILPAQDTPWMYAQMQREHSWIAVDNEGKFHTAFDAFRVLVRSSPVFFFCAQILSLRWIDVIGSYIYRRISSNRKLWGWFASFLRFRPLRLHLTRGENFLVFTLIVSMILLNMGNFLEHRKIADRVAHLFRIHQQWSMFAPYPSKMDGWHIAVGRFTDGTEVDLLRDGKPVSWEQPKNSTEIYKNQHWRKYLERVTMQGKLSTMYSYFGNYLCYTWDRSSVQDGKELREVSVYFMEKITLPHYQHVDPTQILVFKHSCASS